MLLGQVRQVCYKPAALISAVCISCTVHCVLCHSRLLCVYVQVRDALWGFAYLHIPSTAIQGLFHQWSKAMTHHLVTSSSPIRQLPSSRATAAAADEDDRVDGWKAVIDAAGQLHGDWRVRRLREEGDWRGSRGSSLWSAADPVDVLKCMYAVRRYR